MRHSTGTPTAEEVARFELSKEGPCMACVVRMAAGLLPQHLVVVGCDYNHCKSGNRRRGHLLGYALCVWHHRAHPMPRQTTSSTRDRYGPSGSDDELIALQTEWIERQLVMA
ncbi:Ref family recombination enhancement nuclease [Xanthomonas perforans]